MTDNNNKYVLAYRFFVSFDIAISNLDYLEVYFPFTLRIANPKYPKLRLVEYGDTSSYSNIGMEFYNLDSSKFQDCQNNGGINNLFYFNIPSNLDASKLYVIELVPEPTLPLTGLNSYTLDTVGFKVVSYPQQNNYITYAHSANIATLNFQQPTISGQRYVFFNRKSPITFELAVGNNLSAVNEITEQNGGFVVLKVQQTVGIQVTIESCSVTNCYISSNKLFLVAPFTGTSDQVIATVTLSSNASLKQNYPINSYLYSKAPAFYKSTTPNPSILGYILSYSNDIINNSQSLVFKKVLYHWRLPKDSNNEIALYISSSTKYVYNKFTIQFSTDTNISIVDTAKEYFTLSANLGSNYQILQGSFVTNFTPVSSNKNIICRTVNNAINCPNIKELLVNVIYEISFKVIVFDNTSFKLQGISVIYTNGSFSESIADIPFNILNSQVLNFATNADTTNYSSNSSWSPQLADLQVISVPDVGTNNANTIAQRAFYSATANQGGGIFISRGVESLVFFISIDPNTLCNGSCVNLNKIIKMTMIANNNFLKFPSSDTSGLYLAGQTASTTSYSYSGLDCSLSILGCKDGQSSQVLDANNYVQNGKQVDTTYNTAKYTLRCGVSGQAILPSIQCGNMFLGRESALGTYQDGYGGLFYIKQVDLSNSYIPSRVVADDQSPDFLITFSLEDPLNMSSAQTIVLRTMINAYAISYHATDNVQFKSSFVNFSKDNQGLYNPTLFRLRVTNPKDNKRIIIFLDNSIELTSFIDESQATYSCQVITQSDTLAHYDQTSCLAFSGSKALTSTNYNLNNVIIVDTNLSGVTYLEILVPLSPSQTSLIDPKVLHVGYGILVDTFQKGLQSFAIQELISLYGISSKGPSLQNTLASYFSISTLLNEDLTGTQKLYEYIGPSKSITFISAIDPSLSMTFTDTTNQLNYGAIYNDANNKGAGVIITSIVQDPFQGQVNLQTTTGTFPNQTGKCYKFSYLLSRQGENYLTPLDVYKYSKRYSVFCPFDDIATAPSVSIITISNVYSSQSDKSQFTLPILTADSSVLVLSISEKLGRNIAQQNVQISSGNVLIETNSVTAPASGTNININYAFPLNFQFKQFNHIIFLYQPLWIDITMDNNFLQGNYAFISVDVILNGSIKLSSSHSFLASILSISTSLGSTALGQPLNQLDIQILMVRTNNIGNLGTANIQFQCKLYQMLSYFPRTTPEKLIIRYSSPQISLTFASSSAMNVDIDKPIFERNLEGSRDKLQFAFQFSNTNLNKVNFELEESIEIHLGFLRDPNSSQDSCLFYTDSSYAQIDHSVSIFTNYQFKFKTVRPFTQKFYLQCYGVRVFNSADSTSYSIKYYNPLPQDIIATTNRIQELQLASWSRPQSRNGLTITSLGLEQSDAGLNALNIVIQQQNSNLPLFPVGEFKVYFPTEIDLSNFMFTINKPSTTLYIPERHALRIKVQSIDLVASNSQYTLTIFPIFITQQLIDVINNSPKQIYVEYIDVPSQTAIDYAFTSMNSLNFIAFSEKSPERIEITSASYQSGLQKAIDNITISFRVKNNYSIAGSSFKFIVYTRIGSQLNSKSNSLQSSSVSNGFSIFYQTSDISSASDITIQMQTITTLVSNLQDLVLIPIYICLYQDNSLKAMTYLNMINLVGLNLLSSSSVYKTQLYTYISDSEGDQIYAIPLYQNIIDMKQELVYRELNGQSFQIRNPLINIFQTDQVRSYYDYYLFKEDNSSIQKLKQLYLVPNQDVSYIFSYNEVNQVNQFQVNTYFVNNIYKSCSVYSEYDYYYVKQGQTGLTIRIFFDDYCKIIDPNFDFSIVTVTPTISPTLGTIVDTIPLKMTSNRVVTFKINVSAAVPIGTLFNIQYSVSNLANIKIENSEVIAYPSDNNALSLNNIILNKYDNVLKVDISCNENKLIYYELNLNYKKSQLLSDANLIQSTQNGAIKQANQNQIPGQQSTNLIGSIQCNPKSASQLQNTFDIKNLRSNTQYSIKFLIEGSSTSSIYDFNTIQSTTNPLLYLQFAIKQQDSLQQQANPNLIRAQFLCYLSYYISIPYQLLRFSEQPTVSCQQYIDTNPSPFASGNNPQNDSTYCDQISTDSYWHTFDTSHNYDFQFFPIEYGNDTSIFVEMDFSSSKNQYNTSLTNFLTGSQSTLSKLNTLSTSQYISVCSQHANIVRIQNYGNVIEPKIKVIKNSCSRSLRCNFYIQQEQGSSILYFMISQIELDKSVQDGLTIKQFRDNTQLFLMRYVYPLDSNNIAQLNFTIPLPDTNYYAYFFMTDLTIQDYAFQYQGVYNETILFITTYESSNVILYIVLPLVGVVVASGVYFYIRYLRNRNKVGTTDNKKIQDAESNDEDLEQIQELENNKMDNILGDLNTDNRVGSLFGEKEKKFKAQQIISQQGKVELNPSKKQVISSKLVKQHYGGNLDDVEEVILL